jgi:hypothetical protein
VASHTISKFFGLYTSSNDPSQVPQSALRVARNVMLTPTRSLITRIGLAFYGSAVGLEANAMYFFKTSTGKLLIAGSTATKVFDTGGSVTTLQTEGVSPASGTPGSTITTPDVSTAQLRMEEAAGSMFIAEKDWVYALDSESGAARIVGCPQALGSKALTTDNTGTVGKYLADGSSVAYRFTWCRRDGYGRLIEGAPSGREVIVNGAGGARNVSIQVHVPPGITTGHFLRIYRTASIAGTPDENYYLVYEQTGLTSTDIDTNKYTPAVVDVAPDAVLGPALYTNETDGDGTLAANDRPPASKDLCFFDNRMLYSNTTLPSSIVLTLLATNPTGLTGTVALANTNTIVFNDGTARTYTASTAAENIATRTFLLANTGSPSRDVRETAMSLCRVINGNHATDGNLAFYDCDDEGEQGRILIRRTTASSADVAVTVNANGAAWEPALPTSGSTIQSLNETAPHRVYYSKPGQPDAVPALNYVDVGVAQKNIRRIIAFGNRVYVFKEEGLFALIPTGSDIAPFQVESIDDSVVLFSPNSPALLDDALYFLASQGIVRITKSGAIENISGPLQTFANIYNNFDFTTNKTAHAYAHRERHLYILNVTTDTDDCFVYDSRLNAWVTWTVPWAGPGSAPGCHIPVGYGTSGFAGKLVVADNTAGYVRREWEGVANQDEGDSFTISSVDATGTLVTLSSATGATWGTSPQVGDTITRNSRVGKITAWNAGTRVATVDKLTALSLEAGGGAALARAIAVSVQPALSHLGLPDYVKQVASVTYSFRNYAMYSFTGGVLTESATAVSLSTGGVTVTPNTWSTLLVDEDPLPVAPVTKRILVPSAYQRCSYVSPIFEITEAVSHWGLNSITVEFAPTSERNSF